LQNLNTLHAKQEAIIDFSVVNLDTVFWSLLMGLLVTGFLLIAARRATAGVPGRFQAMVELLVEFVETQSKNIVHGDRSYIAPLALFVFCWIILMNTLDLVPVDWVHGVNGFLGIFGSVHVPHHKLVPTTDLNATLGMSLSVLILMIFYSLKIKGVGGICTRVNFSTVWRKVVLSPIQSNHELY